jgi:uncharacterized protein (DUF488 family)
MIYTSNYNSWHSTKIKPVTISGDRGKDAKYEGAAYLDLAPKKTWWRTWKDNIGKIPEEENTRYYVEQYWLTVLSKLDPEQVLSDLDNSALLCYEPNMKFCHRHLVAAWLEITLGIEVPEAKANNDKIETLPRPTWIKELLEETMRKNLDMKGFKSLRALYLYEKGLKKETQAEEIMNKAFTEMNQIRREALELRLQAINVEKEYKQSKKEGLGQTLKKVFGIKK